MSFFWFLMALWTYVRYALFRGKVPRYRRKSGHPSVRRQGRKPRWVVQDVLRIKALCPKYGHGRVAMAFNRGHAGRGMSVSRSFVAYTLRNHRYEIACLRRNIRRRLPFGMAKNEIWALDLTGRADRSGRVHAILGVLDHGSRRLLCLKPLARQCAWSLLGYLCLAIAAHGRPRFLRSDNAPVFHSRVFRRGARWMGIRQQFSKPGCPWMNGRIERLFGTLKAVLRPLVFENGQALDELLWKFRFAYDTLRPHSALGGATPDEAWKGIDPGRLPPKGIIWIHSGIDDELGGFYLRR